LWDIPFTYLLIYQNDGMTGLNDPNGLLQKNQTNQTNHINQMSRIHQMNKSIQKHPSLHFHGPATSPFLCMGHLTNLTTSPRSSSPRSCHTYPEDEPYPSCLIYGKTSEGRPLHIVCAYAEDANCVIIITAYEPSPNRWIDFERRPK
jgi:hypothetical protein